MMIDKENVFFWKKAITTNTTVSYTPLTLPTIA